MHFLTVDSIGDILGLLLQAVLVWTLIRKGLVKTYPIFILYLLLNVAEAPLPWVLRTDSILYTRLYLATSVLDFLLQLLILFEIGRNVLVRSKGSRPSPVWILILTAALTSVIFSASFSPLVKISNLQQAFQSFYQVTLGLAILKLVLFAGLAVFAQFLGLTWRNHVLQLATGLAFYGGVSVLIAMSLNHLQGADHGAHHFQAVRLTELQALAFISTLVFWIWAFSRNEAPRKDFTPQMQQVLVTIASTARRTRIAVTRSGEQP